MEGAIRRVRTTFYPKLFGKRYGVPCLLSNFFHLLHSLILPPLLQSTSTVFTASSRAVASPLYDCVFTGCAQFLHPTDRSPLSSPTSLAAPTKEPCPSRALSTAGKIHLCTGSRVVPCRVIELHHRIISLCCQDSPVVLHHLIAPIHRVSQSIFCSSVLSVCSSPSNRKRQKLR
jgi:hypothetical protein